MIIPKLQQTHTHTHTHTHPSRGVVVSVAENRSEGREFEFHPSHVGVFSRDHLLPDVRVASLQTSLKVSPTLGA